MRRKTIEKKPFLRVRRGAFSLTLWRVKRLLCSPNPDAINYIEKEVEIVRVCLQHSVKSKIDGKWINQQIWFNDLETRDLANLLEDLNRKLTGEDEEEDSSSKSSSSKKGGKK